MSNSYDATKIGVLEGFGPTRLDLLVHKRPSEWSSDDWLAAVLWADDGGSPKERLLGRLREEYPAADAHSVMEFSHHVRRPIEEG